MENYKELLSALYKEHAPDKLDQIDFYLDRYKGKEKQFYITQKAKYAKKRSVTDSKKILEEAMARIRAQKEKTAASKKQETKKSISKPIIKTAAPKKLTVKDPVLQEKKAVEIEAKNEKPKIQDLAKKEKQAVIEEKQDVIIKKTSTTLKQKKEEKSEEKLNVKIVDTTASLNPSLKKSNDEPITSPLNTNREELKPKAEEKETINKTTISDKEKKLLELEEAKARLAKSRKKEDKKSFTIWYVGAIALLVLIVASVVYFTKFYNNENQSKEPVRIQKVVVENKKISTDQNEAPEETTKEEKATVKEIAPVVKEEPQKEIAPVKKEEPKKVIVQEKPAKKQSRTQPTAERLYSKDFSHPAIFVGCFAVKSESLAQKKVAQLKEHKLKAHYYWIPDMDAGGNEYFKVVIGPFDSLSNAYPSLTKVQERINFDAYIIILQ